MLQKDKKNYRLGIDLGSTSLGWCMLELNEQNEPCGIINMGVRIFPDGRDAKSKKPLSVARRGFRGQRRNLDRYLERMKTLIAYLTQHGFLPLEDQARNDVFMLNPYQLRYQALDTELRPAEFARAIIHLAKRRGFRSNRKIMSDKKTAYTQAIDNLKIELQKSGARTLGEYLWQRYNLVPDNQEHLRKPLKFRYEILPENPEPIFPLREMVEHEFDLIWEAQRRYNSLLTDDHKDTIHKIIFTQKPLQPQPKGKCQLLPNEDRAPKAHPLFQEFRLRQDLNNLKVIDVFTNEVTELTNEQYDLLYASLNQKKEMTFEAMRKLCFGKKAGDYRLNYETENRSKLQGNLTNHEIHRKDNLDIAKLWDIWSDETKSQVIELIISDLDDEPKIAKLSELGIDSSIADKMLDLHLPADYGHLSLRAINLILPYMRKRVIYSSACEAAGFNHSLEYDGRIFDEGNLPYYGELLKRETIELKRKIGDHEADEHGRINNPTVHIALNQLRKVVNALCEKYGKPREIILELGKEIKLSMAEKEKLEKQQRRNTKQNEKIDAFLEECGVISNALNRLKAKLWFELGADETDRRCIYTGHQINVTDLFSDKIEIDHILPKSRTYDDSSANKLICFREANRYKLERSPHEAFGESHDGYNWESITARAKYLPDNKRWRFQQDAMEDYTDKEKILARMLNDTRYMSRVAMKYMFYVVGDRNVTTITGRHTGLLRKKWGLNSALSDDDTKNRNDHRHHAIDAFVISLTTRSLVKKIADRIESSVDRFIEKLDPPYADFDYYHFTDKVSNIKVSYKPDHVNISRLKANNQTGGALAEETAYALVGPDPNNPKYNLYAVRKAISDITEKNYTDIANPYLKSQIAMLAETAGEEKFADRLKTFATRHNIKKVKLHFAMNPKSMIPVKDKQGRAFKYLASGENLFADIYLKDPSQANAKWEIEIVNSYNTHQPGFVPQWKKDYPKAQKVMRVFKNDIIALDAPDGTRELRRVRKMTNGIIYLRELNIGKKDKGKEDIGEQYGSNRLQQLHARKAGIDIIGRVFDPIVNEL